MREFFYIDSDLILRDEIISDQIYCNLAARDIYSVRSAKGKLKSEMIEMPTEPAPLMIPLLQKTKVVNLNDLLPCYFISVKFHFNSYMTQI